MNWYCEKCKKIHIEDELCPIIREELLKHPNWIKEASDLAVAAGEQALITSQALDKVAQEVNSIAGTKLSYEGTRQFTRDIQVFKRLNEEPFKRAGVFSSPDVAKSYFENVMEVAKEKPGALTSFESKLTGYGQEVDWLRTKQESITSIWEKSTLLENNAPGIDGVTINRFTGNEISRTTIKASKNPMTANSTGIKDVEEAIKKGTATKKDIIFGPEGTEAAARNRGLENPVLEKNSSEQIQNSNKRLEEKILNAQAVTAPTLEQIKKKMSQGAIVGAAVAVTISTITTYVRYRNGELSKEEAFCNVAEDTIQGLLVGAAMGPVNIFLPCTFGGYVAGMAIGIYLNKTCTNILDEILGKGAYGAILNASGYTYGMTFNLAEYYERIENNNKNVDFNLNRSKEAQKIINQKFACFEQMKGND